MNFSAEDIGKNILVTSRDGGVFKIVAYTDKPVLTIQSIFDADERVSLVLGSRETQSYTKLVPET